MSNVLAVAAVTSTLRNLLLAQMPVLDPELTDLEVTTQPPDLARKSITKAQLNLFLYQIAFNPAWRNMDVPRQTRPGETAPPALPLNMHFLITAYGRGESDNDSLSHRVLASAMSVLNDHAVLGRDEIRNALANNDLADQLERVRIAPQAFSTDELFKLWTAFQTNYRISTAYEVSVVLIDSRSSARAALPVLKRGPEDRGVTAVASAAPQLESLQLPRSQSAVRLGEDFVLVGKQLASQNATLRFTNLRLDAPIEVAPAAGDVAGTLKVHLQDTSEDPGANARWAPGQYTVGLTVTNPPAPAFTSNEVGLALAPRITVAPSTAAAGTITVNVACSPRIRAGQRVLLLFGDAAVAPQSLTNPADTTQPTALVFQISGVTPGKYMLRLRVDGADSIPVDFTTPTPTFDATQQVTVT